MLISLYPELDLSLVVVSVTLCTQREIRLHAHFSISVTLCTERYDFMLISLYPELDLSLAVVSVTLCTERDTTSCSFHGFLLQFSKTRICAHCGLSPFPVVPSANGLLVWSESLLASCKTSVTLC